MRLQGVGPKTARRIFDELGLTTVDDVREAAQAGRIRALSGHGREDRGGDPGGAGRRRRLGRRRRAGRSRGCVPSASGWWPTCARATAWSAASWPAASAGSRRRPRTSTSSPPCPTASPPPRRSPRPSGSPRSSRAATAASPPARTTARVVELRMVPPGCYGNLLQHLTGSKAHNVALREAAVRAGLKVSEYGIEQVESGEVWSSDEEADVYAHLGPAVDPAGAARGPRRARGRAGREAARARRGERHPRRPARRTPTGATARPRSSRWSPPARARGYEYMNITDHSPAVGFGMGLDAGRLHAQIERVRALAATLAPELHPARRGRGGHPPRRVARLLRRAAGAARRRRRERARVAPALGRRPDQARLRGAREPATSTSSATPPGG